MIKKGDGDGDGDRNGNGNENGNARTAVAPTRLNCNSWPHEPARTDSSFLISTRVCLLGRKSSLSIFLDEFHGLEIYAQQTC